MGWTFVMVAVAGPVFAASLAVAVVSWLFDSIPTHLDAGEDRDAE